MSGVSNPVLQEKLTKFRENAVLPRHLAKNQQDLVLKKKHASMLETEKVMANISGEEFRLKHIDLVKDVPRVKLFINDILPLMKEKNDWHVLPNVLQGLKTVGFQMKLPVAEKIVRTAGLNGQQNVILECLRRTKDTGMNLNNPILTKTVLFWIFYKAHELDETVECIKKSLSMAEQVLTMLEDIDFTGKRFQDNSTHQRNHSETLGIPLSIAALLVSKSKSGKDKNGIVAKYATQFVKKSLVTPSPNLTGAINEAKRVCELGALIETHLKTQNLEEAANTRKMRNIEREKLGSRLAQWIHYMLLNNAIITGIKTSLPLLDSTFEYKTSLEERLLGLEKSVSEVESAWRELYSTQGKQPKSFLLSKISGLKLSNAGV